LQFGLADNEDQYYFIPPAVLDFAGWLNHRPQFSDTHLDDKSKKTRTSAVTCDMNLVKGVDFLTLSAV
jgi:hypothetical protein